MHPWIDVERRRILEREGSTEQVKEDGNTPINSLPLALSLSVVPTVGLFDLFSNIFRQRSCRSFTESGDRQGRVSSDLAFW